ncbi:MAG: SPOR domain-containing protein [Gemmatimonadaceae bacterium]
MRALHCLAVLLVACSDRRTADNPNGTNTAARPTGATIRGPDALFLRIPRAGGAARVVAFPNLDSTVWTSTGLVDPPGRILGFDDNAGVVTLLDAKSRPVLIDFRSGRIDDGVRIPLTAAVSLDGSTIYGVTAKGDVIRRSTSDSVRFRTGAPARGVFPLRDGSILVWSGRESRSTLSRIRPPSSEVVDSLSMPVADIATGTGVGDRLYFASGDKLQAVQTRTLQLSEPIPVGGPISDIAVTPSGDRIYVLAEVAGRATLIFVDRYRWLVSSTLPLEGNARELRVDPIGRYVLVRGARDSVTVIGIAANRVVGTVRSEWRSDLPLVSPDASIATVAGTDVVFVGAEDQRPISRVGGGAADLWFTFWWTGFRPRAAGLDQPVTFDSATTVIDSTQVTAVDSLERPATDSVPRPQAFTVSFFTLLSEARAQAEAANIRVDNETAHVETVVRNGLPMYRVILGPYATCAEAQRVAKASAKSGVWIPEGGCDVPPAANEPLAR